VTDRVSFTWSARRDVNDGYVLEQGPNGHSIEFGPMPCNIVTAFVEGRRRIVAMQAEKHGASYVDNETDYTFLTSPEGEKLQ
jgi:hypothetical protein